MDSWYVVTTDPRSEDVASQALTREGISNYLPKVKSTTGGHAPKLVPIFPGYLFVKCDKDSQHALKFGQSTKCIGWVNFEGFVPAIPEEFMIELSARLESINDSEGLWRKFREGETVQLSSNGIDSIAEILEPPRSSEAPATVLFRFMGRLVKAKVPWEGIRPMEMINSECIRTRGTRGKGRRIWY